MRIPLSPGEEAYTREVAAQLGRDPAGMIAEGDELKGQAYADAHAAAQASMDRIGAAGGGQMYPGAGPLAELEAMEGPDPELKAEAEAELEAELG
jgi:hypothetical protein